MCWFTNSASSQEGKEGRGAKREGGSASQGGKMGQGPEKKRDIMGLSDKALGIFLGAA